jgi:hypothetical protein
MTVHEAVVALRKHRKETQQEFAWHMDLSISGLQNYEKNRVPEARQLLIFQRQAQMDNRLDLAEIFRQAFAEALGFGPIGHALFETNDWFETTAVSAVLANIRSTHRSVEPLIKAIAECIDPEVFDPAVVPRSFLDEAIRRGLIGTPKTTRRKKQK